MKVIKTKEFAEAYDKVTGFTKIPWDYGTELDPGPFKLLMIILHSRDGFRYTKAGLSRKLGRHSRYIDQYLDEIQEAGFIHVDGDEITLTPYQVAETDDKATEVDIKPQSISTHTNTRKVSRKPLEAKIEHKNTNSSYSLEDLINF